MASSFLAATDGRRQWPCAARRYPRRSRRREKAPEYYIGEQGVKRKRVSGRFDLEERGRRGMPNLAPGNSQTRTGQRRRATGPPDPENPQARRKPPPKPEGRLNRPNRKR